MLKDLVVLFVDLLGSYEAQYTIKKPPSQNLKYVQIEDGEVLN